MLATPPISVHLKNLALGRATRLLALAAMASLMAISAAEAQWMSAADRKARAAERETQPTEGISLPSVTESGPRVVSYDELAGPELKAPRQLRMEERESTTTRKTSVRSRAESNRSRTRSDETAPKRPARRVIQVAAESEVDQYDSEEVIPAPEGTPMESGYGPEYIDEGPYYGPAAGPVDSCGPGGPCYHGGYCGEPGCDTGYTTYGPVFPLHERLYLRTDVLLWWTEGFGTPPLVTTSPQGTAEANAGVLGRSSTSILFGDQVLTDDVRTGGRYTLGWWFDPCKTTGIEATYLGLGEESSRFFSSSTGDPILARPFFNVQTALQDSGLIAFDEDLGGGETQNIVEGSIRIGAVTEFQTLEISLRHALVQECDWGIDFLVGYRWAQLDDDLRIRESTISNDPQGPAPVGTTFVIDDLFDTRNTFHGVQLGFLMHKQYYRWSLDMALKLGLGNSHAEVVIDGQTVTTAPGEAPETFDGGFLALDSNMGEYHANETAIIPELGITLGYQLTPRLKATFGYSFIYWSRTARPGDQVDLNLNPSQFPPADLDGVPSPQFPFTFSDFWAQGLNFGLDYRF